MGDLPILGVLPACIDAGGLRPSNWYRCRGQSRIVSKETGQRQRPGSALRVGASNGPRTDMK
jgi:hypothetical protein